MNQEAFYLEEFGDWYFPPFEGLSNMDQIRRESFLVVLVLVFPLL